MPSFTLKCCSILCSRVTHCEPLLRLLGNQRRVANQKEASLLFFYGFQIFCGPFIHSGIFMATVLNHCTCLHQTPLVIMLVKILSSSAATSGDLWCSCWTQDTLKKSINSWYTLWLLLNFSSIKIIILVGVVVLVCLLACLTHKLLFLHPPFWLHVHLYINKHPYIQTQNVVTFTENLVPSLIFLLWMWFFVLMTKDEASDSADEIKMTMLIPRVKSMKNNK